MFLDSCDCLRVLLSAKLLSQFKLAISGYRVGDRVPSPDDVAVLTIGTGNRTHGSRS